MIKYKGLYNPHIAQSLALLSGQRTIQRVVSQKPNRKRTKFSTVITGECEHEDPKAVENLQVSKFT